ncbi:lysR substrate binding domain protein [Ralstonia insidiosa]|uniref:LysR substrate binding domain protein n=1 Tax=Ralstonia insidiosa TaxID=190721 RepID=A0AAC9BLE0_9RALS|nr:MULTISPECIES: LysR family transcriptional regulator [Ralstonia]ANH76516.1 lysR substrate binding domain protein [Ralstonia insidiosa]EPX99590.1 LysR family transcriptional regulator [Ralstonia sp. AU12-08]MBY4705075.1 LysR family transcriptional regulator [Ralstonia insidiosa]GAQ29202.1 lysR family transcriptional regulator [Ralstonia sp. NT80]
MTDSADLRFLLAIQENGSLVATARALGLTPSAVSQRLQQLEKKLGARLVDRTARSLRFTQEGALLCERGAELIRQLDALSEDLQTRQGGLVGTLKVNAPLGFGRRYIAPVISDFQQEHPDVDIELMLSDAPLTEAAERFDVVVHIGALQVSNRVGYAIAPNARLLCASPAFIKRHGMPETPDDLAALPCIVLRENKEDVSLWHFSKGRTSRSVRVQAKLICNDGDVIRRWACEGRGAILRSEWDVADDLRAGRLVRLLPGWKAPDANVIALTHNRAGLPQRTRHFMQFLQGRFKPQPPWRA